MPIVTKAISTACNDHLSKFSPNSIFYRTSGVVCPQNRCVPGNRVLTESQLRPPPASYSSMSSIGLMGGARERTHLERRARESICGTMQYINVLDLLPSPRCRLNVVQLKVERPMNKVQGVI